MGQFQQVTSGQSAAISRKGGFSFLNIIRYFHFYKKSLTSWDIHEISANKVCTPRTLMGFRGISRFFSDSNHHVRDSSSYYNQIYLGMFAVHKQTRTCISFYFYKTSKLFHNRFSQNFQKNFSKWLYKNKDRFHKKWIFI